MNLRRIRVPLLALALTGCSLVTGTHESLTVYSPQPPVAATPQPAPPWQLIVAEPQALAPLGGDRIVVMPQAGVIEFYKGVRWRDRATLILQDLLVQALQSSGSQAAVGRADSGMRGDFVLQSDLRGFQAEYRASGAPTVVIRIDAQLVDSATRRIVATRSVTIEQPASSTAVAAVFAAFEQGLGQAIAPLVDWSREAGTAAWGRREPGRVPSQEVPGA